MIYSYVGASSTVGDREFDRLGQRAEFSDEQAQSVVFAKGGALFIPEQEFVKLFPDEQELETYGYAGAFPEPPQDFVERLARARAFHADLCSRIHNPATLAEEHPPVVSERDGQN